jgi:HEAT repeat protein
MMIEIGHLEIVGSLMKSQDAEVREQAALLLGKFAISAIGRQWFDQAFPNMITLLEDETLSVRQATAWIYERLSVNDDGV